MYHFLLIIWTYAIFIGVIYDLKRKRKIDGDYVDPPISITFAIIYLIILTALYEKLLQFILLNKIDSYGEYISFSPIGSGIYMILFFLGLVILGKLLGCPAPNLWTIITFLVMLTINIFIMLKSTNIYYDILVKEMGNNLFDNFYDSLIHTERLDIVNTLLNIKWTVMIVPGLFYLGQILFAAKSTSSTQ